MRALVKTGPAEGDLAVQEWAEPAPAPHEVKLRVAAAGICGTDIHILRGTWRCDYPVVIGHEFCGTVVDTGSRVEQFRRGDRVVAANPARTCGLCHHCIAGNPFMCADRVSAGYMIDGAFAEYICIDQIRCHNLAPHVTFRDACLGEPISVAVHAVIERTQVHTGDVAFVSGPGCVGLLVAQMAQLEGARVVLAGIDRDRARLECARRIGIDEVVNLDERDPLETVRELTDGRGADIVFECAGVAESLATCWQAVRKEGTLVPVGMYPGPIKTDFGSISMKDLRVIGTYGYVWTSWQRTVRLLAEGRIVSGELVSHAFSLEAFEEAFRTTSNGKGVKVIFEP